MQDNSRSRIANYVGGAVVVVSDNKPLILYLLSIVGIGDIKASDVVKKITIWNLMFLITITTFSLAGIVPNETYMHNGEIAYCLGYYYYSSCAYYVFFITITGYLSISGKYKKSFEALYIMVGILVNYVTYRVCTVRLTLYCFVLFVVLTFIYKNTKIFKNNLLYRLIATLMFPCASIVTILLSVFYQRLSFGAGVNLLLNARLSLNYQAFQRYSVSLLGNHIETHAAEFDQNWVNQYFYIDSGYVNSLLSSGLLLFALGVIAYTLISRMAIRENNYKIFVWSLIACVFSAVNDAFFSTCLNPLLLFTAAAFKSEIAARKGKHIRKRYKFKNCKSTKNILIMR